MPQRADGLRMDPLVSVPMPNATQPAGRGGCRTRRRSARSLLQIPRVLGLPAEPLVALRQFARSQLRHQHRARVAQHLDHARVFVDHLVFICARAPRGLVALHRDDVFRAPGNPMQRPAILARLRSRHRPAWPARAPFRRETSPRNSACRCTCAGAPRYICVSSTDVTLRVFG